MMTLEQFETLARWIRAEARLAEARVIFSGQHQHWDDEADAAKGAALNAFVRMPHG